MKVPNRAVDLPWTQIPCQTEKLSKPIHTMDRVQNPQPTAKSPSDLYSWGWYQKLGSKYAIFSFLRE